MISIYLLLDCRRVALGLRQLLVREIYDFSSNYGFCGPLLLYWNCREYPLEQ